MLEFFQENPMRWGIKLIDCRRRDKKNKIWDEQSKRLDNTPEYLKGWFKSPRDIKLIFHCFNISPSDIEKCVQAKKMTKIHVHALIYRTNYL